MSYDGIIQRVIPWVEFHQNRYARLLDLAVQPGCRWLDIGAGVQLHWGWVGASCAQLASRASLLVGCDLEGPHLALNRDLHAAVRADGARLPFPSASFDLVTANMVLEHLPRPERVFAEIARVLRRHGAFAFVTPNLRHPAVRVLSVVASRPARRVLGHWADSRPLEHVFETHYLANSEADLARLALASGFAVRTLETFPSYPMFRRSAPLTWLECLFIKGQRAGWRRRFSSNLVGLFERA